MNYPKGIKHDTTKDKDYITYGNRGMDLEEDINITNKYYVDNNIAFIYKKPTPIQVTKIDYNSKGIVIKEAFFKEPSTTDYNGLYKGNERYNKEQGKANQHQSHNDSSCVSSLEALYPSLQA